MFSHSHEQNKVFRILAADFRTGEINPENDHVWELDTAKGQPPAVSLRSSFGLRAYGIRIYPSFLLNGIPHTDPLTFLKRPSLLFSASNFAALRFSPFYPIDVNQRVWVPDSNTLMGETTLTNQGGSLLQLTMEWIVQLNPLPDGSPMAVQQMSVNTILSGRTDSLFPVFYLTGGPRGDTSASPALGVEVSLKPSESRRFSWALAAKETLEESFFHARTATTYSLEQEGLSLAMLQNHQEVRFETVRPDVDERLQANQRRLFQLFLPPSHNFAYPSYIRERNPEAGNAPARAIDFQTHHWGVQQITDILCLSRVLPPARSDLLQGLVQNLIDSQEEGGKISSFCGWKGPVSTLTAAPMLATLALEAYHSNADQEWLAGVYPALLRFFEHWFQPENDRDHDNWPEWSDLLQTGLLEAEGLSISEKIEMEVLARCAEWPSLAALLIKEGESMRAIEAILAIHSPTGLYEKTEGLRELIQLTWDEKEGIFRYRDQETHQVSAGRLLYTIKQNGKKADVVKFTTPTRIIVSWMPKNGDLRPVECQIKGVVNRHVKKVLFSSTNLRCQGEYSFAISEDYFSKIQEVTVRGLKRGDILEIRSPDHHFRGPDFIIPLWAGLLTPKQADTLVKRGQKYISKLGGHLPLFIKIMWIEGLLKYQFKALAANTFADWFLCNDPGFSSDPPNLRSTTGYRCDPLSPMNPLHKLIPLAVLLKLLGIEKLSEQEILLNGFNIFSSKVIVQYKKTTLECGPDQTTVTGLNGESVIVTETGMHRIRLENKEDR